MPKAESMIYNVDVYDSASWWQALAGTPPEAIMVEAKPAEAFEGVPNPDALSWMLLQSGHADVGGRHYRLSDRQPVLFLTLAVYRVDRAYGGPEEGGWYYNCGELRLPGPRDIASEQFHLFLPNVFFAQSTAERDYARGVMKQRQAMLDIGPNKGLPPISSVSSQGRYEAMLCEGFPKPHFPATPPVYE